MPNNKWYTPAGKSYNFHAELLQQKHLLIAGAAGSGKSVLLNGIIYEALFSAPQDTPGGKQFILIDQKGHELDMYEKLPHTLRYAVEPSETIQALQYAVALMESRDQYMRQHHQRIYDGGDVYIFIDEFADLMTTSKKAVVPLIQRLAQRGRSARIHVFLCTQCPLAKIIPTEIKVNFDSIVGLHTANRQHSRNIIDVPGCEDLEIGEALYTTPSRPVTHVSGIPLFTDEEIAARVAWWTDQTRPSVSFLRRIWPKQEYKINLTL